jgi:putative membrane protein
MKRTFLIIAITGICLFNCGKPEHQQDNNPAEAAESEGQKDKDNAETIAEAEADAADQPGAARQNTKPDQQFAMEAAEAGLTEVKLGKLAETQASNADIKAFATMMVKDHTSANTELQRLAGTKGISLPADCQNCERKYSELKELQGEAFDNRYVQMMINDHKDAVSKFTTQSTQGTDSDLKSWANAKLSTLKHHLSLAESLGKQRSTGR